MMKKKQSKLTLAKNTVRQLNVLASEQIAEVAAAGTHATGYGMCRRNVTFYCSVGGGRGICM
jgi:hypothetical protein